MITYFYLFYFYSIPVKYHRIKIDIQLRMPSPKIISGTSHQKLAEHIAKCAGVELVQVTKNKFSNGEVNIIIHENIRNEDVFIIQTECSVNNYAPNDLLMELYLFVDACKRSSAKSITAIIPSFFYARADKKDNGRCAIGASLVAKQLEMAGVTRVVAVDLHAAQIQGFFNVPCDNLFAKKLLVSHLQENYFTGFSEEELNEKFILVSPDNGGTKRVTSYSDTLGINNVIMHKQRNYSKVNTVDKTILIGDYTLSGKTAIVIDDMCDTMGTMVKACETLADNGISEVVVVATHGILSGLAIERLEQCKIISEVIVTNTIPQDDNLTKSKKIEIVDISGLICSVINCIMNGESISGLF